MLQLSEILSLIILVFVAVTLVVIGDTAGKLLTTSGVEPTLVAWLRFILAAIFIFPFSGFSLREVPSILHRRILLRAASITCGIFCIVTALETEPMANVFGAFFVGPIVSYLLAIIFLGERPSILRSLLLITGFIGVLMVVKPGFGASSGMAYALGAGIAYGCYLVMTRTVANDFRPRFLLLSQLLVGSIILTPFAINMPMPELKVSLIFLFFISAFGSAMGNFLLVLANRRAEASLIAPLVYSQLISAMVIGVLVFGEWPDFSSLIGLILIGTSGVASLFNSKSWPKTMES